MSTFYLDYEGGNDAADGLSFANRWKTLTTGATAARIAPGDTIRIMGSPAPTSLGVNGTWTDGPLPATISITSSTNATPIVVTKASHGLTTGDTVVVTGHTTNTNANGTWEVNVLTSSTFELVGSVGNGVGGATGTFRLRNNSRVWLATAVTKTVQDCGFQSGAWTASASVTATISTADFKEGYGSSSIDIAAGFTTGLAAYKALGASTDFSGYKQISFWIKQTAGTIGAAGAVQIKLCSDTAGATPVDTFDIPNLTALNRWVPVTVDKGSALGAAIQSVSFNVVTDNGAQTFLIDNIIACKDSTSADSLSLASLIGKNSGTETWCAIQSITGKRVMLEQGNNVLPTSTSYRGYAGTTETVTAYKRETIKTALAATITATVQSLTDSGSVGSLIAIEGGWDRTAMTTQNLETWFDGVNGFGYGILFASKSYFSVNKINCVRYCSGLRFTSCTAFALDNFSINNCSRNSTSDSPLFFSNCYNVDIGTIGSVSYNEADYGIQFTSASDFTIDLISHIDGNSSSGILTGQSNILSRRIFIGAVYANNNSSTGIYAASSADCIIYGGSSKNNGGIGILFSASYNVIAYDLVTSGNSSAGASAANGGVGRLVRASISEATEVSTFSGTNGTVFSQDHDTTVGNHQIFTDGGLISSDTTTRHTASGICWKMSPTSAIRASGYPLFLSLAKVACVASSLVTVKAWMRRSNTGLTMRLVCKGGQIGGVTTDQVASMTAAADTYEELTITFTPSADGVVEIIAEAYGGTTYNGYVDDMTITQA